MKLLKVILLSTLCISVFGCSNQDVSSDKYLELYKNSIPNSSKILDLNIEMISTHRVKSIMSIFRINDQCFLDIYLTPVARNATRVLAPISCNSKLETKHI